MENLIELSNVTLTYPPTARGISKLFSKQAKNSHALKDVTFVLPKGQSLALIAYYEFWPEYIIPTAELLKLMVEPPLCLI